MNGNSQGLTTGNRAAGLEITGLGADSRDMRPGALFAALPGARADGAAFIPDAVRRGAVAVLAPPGATLPAGCET
ncbi:MAG: Mur ligase domain-containing protein, partial [Alphaproteobacteria bacterium]